MTFQQTLPDPNQSFSRMSRQSLDLSLSSDMLNASMSHYPSPVYNISTTPRFDTQGLYSHPMSAQQPIRKAQPGPRNYGPFGIQPASGQSYSTTNITPGMQMMSADKVNMKQQRPSVQTNYIPNKNLQRNTTTYSNFSMTNTQQTPNSARRDYKPTMTSREAFVSQNKEYFQGNLYESKNDTLKQSLSLLKMANFINHRRRNHPQNFASMIETSSQTSLQEHHLTHRAYPRHPSQNFNPQVNQIPMPQYPQRTTQQMIKQRTSPSMYENTPQHIQKRKQPKNLSSFNSQKAVPVSMEINLDPNFQSPDFKGGRFMTLF
jgi:hypothetical protein